MKIKVYLVSPPICSYSSGIRLTVRQSWLWYQASFAPTIKAQPQLCPGRCYTLLRAYLWADHSLSDTVNQTGMNVKETQTKTPLRCVSHHCWRISSEPLQDWTQSHVHSRDRKTLQGSKVITVQKTLCGAVRSTNTVTRHSLERNHSWN